MSRCCVPSVAQSAAFALAHCEAAWDFLKSADPEDIAWLGRFRDIVIRNFMAGPTTPMDTDAPDMIRALLSSPEGLDRLRQHAQQLYGMSLASCHLMCAHSF